MDKYDVLKHDDKFRYMLLSRMQSDCNYYLGNGNRSVNSLWAENEKEQIEVMKELWNSFADDEKPEWLTWDELLNYEAEMVGVGIEMAINKAKHQSVGTTKTFIKKQK